MAWNSKEMLFGNYGRTWKKSPTYCKFSFRLYKDIFNYQECVGKRRKKLIMTMSSLECWQVISDRTKTYTSDKQNTNFKMSKQTSWANTIIPKPESRNFWRIPLLKQIWGDLGGLVAIICPETSHPNKKNVTSLESHVANTFHQFDETSDTRTQLSCACRT